MVRDARVPQNLSYHRGKHAPTFYQRPASAVPTSAGSRPVSAAPTSATTRPPSGLQRSVNFGGNCSSGTRVVETSTKCRVFVKILVFPTCNLPIPCSCPPSPSLYRARAATDRVGCRDEAEREDYQAAQLRGFPPSAVSGRRCDGNRIRAAELHHGFAPVVRGGPAAVGTAADAKTAQCSAAGCGAHCRGNAAAL